ncbi:MAG: sensor histidine kinase [Sphingomonas bacterium]|nr:sensor histidine kinase [Sphingomonas bacterium]
MADPRDVKIGAWRSRIGQRLYVRIYVALLVSLIVASVLFGMARMRFDPVPGTLHSSIHAHVHMLVVLMAIALVVAAAAYPVVRRLTGRLERLQTSVEAWGSGDLSTRVAVEGRDEVAQLARSFNESAARVDALVGAQKALLANASHELRSPLARIGMAVALLQDVAPATIRAELARNIAELDLLIGEVLLASRLDAVTGAERPAVAVDLTALVAEECARVGANLAAGMVETRGDPALLRRMVRNLLENAQRHGGDTPIAVALTQSAGAIQLEICDGGPGVPAAEHEAIFAPFYRARGASEADGGHGLGLSLVRQIARRHGGDVSCVERPAGGGCFRVVLPHD